MSPTHDFESDFITGEDEGVLCKSEGTSLFSMSSTASAFFQKRLRQYTWKDHYFPNSTAEDERLNRLHTDISHFTHRWSRDNLWPRADFTRQHKCVKFDMVNAWAGQRRVDASQPGILTHPIYGIHPRLVTSMTRQDNHNAFYTTVVAAVEVELWMPLWNLNLWFMEDMERRPTPQYSGCGVQIRIVDNSWLLEEIVY
ncbi:hypothetical protein BKA67DRAFT_678490 [Truncatella angustata]|uniref:Uncharacterized protein n=1 Tax=Truncatella angustata TaxID=152316 RepID=A0A9P8UJJ9_9PEZI|nr:uncharacterized protein BKA67DRAFT_678490 [Truncatella angustata]KAH6653279.1 hypothetical protein BKA67DRAFT_678490 [Truncatella angustata]